MRVANTILLGLHAASTALAAPQAIDAVTTDIGAALEQVEALGLATFEEIQEKLELEEAAARKRGPSPPGGQPKCTLANLQIRREW